MKTDKEYPATHSMSTAWFAVDAEGNVAILDYDDNGPVPVFVPESSEEEIICEYFATQIPGEPFLRWNFSEEEFERILASQSACEFELEEEQDDIFNAVVKVDISRFDKFLEAARLFEEYNTICINLEKGLFFVNWWGYEKNQSQAVKDALSSGLVTPIKHLTFDNWEADPDILSSYPFFVYRQDYDCSKLLERTVKRLGRNIPARSVCLFLHRGKHSGCLSSSRIHLSSRWPGMSSQTFPLSRRN